MWQRASLIELDLAGYGLKGKEDELFRTEGIVFAFPKPEAPLSEILQHLEHTYCGTMALEVAHLEVSWVGSVAEMITEETQSCNLLTGNNHVLGWYIQHLTRSD